VDQVIGRDRLPCSDDIPNLTYVTATALEAIRWRSGSRVGVPHYANADEIYNGMLIPKGATIIPNAWSMSRDPDVFPDWDVVRPERYLTSDGKIDNSVPVAEFGFGRRICPGQNLALRSLTMALSCMAWSFTFEKARDSQGQVIEPSLSPEAADDGGLVFPGHRYPYAMTLRNGNVAAAAKLAAANAQSL